MGILHKHSLRTRPDLPYMTPAEAAQFKAMRKAGAITFFKTFICDTCADEIPISKKFCSKKCYEVKNGTGVSEG